MSREPIRVRHRAPLRVAVGRAQIGDHDSDSLASASAFALAGCGNRAHVGQLITCSAPAATPASRATEKVLASSGGVELVTRIRLPGVHGTIASAAACTHLAIIVVLEHHVRLGMEVFDMGTYSGRRKTGLVAAVGTTASRRVYTAGAAAARRAARGWFGAGHGHGRWLRGRRSC